MESALTSHFNKLAQGNNPLSDIYFIVYDVILFSRFLYLTIVFFDVSENISCSYPNDEHNHTAVNYSLVNCTVAPLKTAGSVDINTAVAKIFFGVTALIAALESVFVTVLPVLGGDQVRF